MRLSLVTRALSIIIRTLLLASPRIFGTKEKPPAPILDTPGILERLSVMFEDIFSSSVSLGMTVSAAGTLADDSGYLKAVTTISSLCMI